ncbi:hypothetical protein NBRC111893_36 [Lentilactobacillus kosonis]|uniref:Uncharacterized protein n=1 Tax=Lentilactobacillus kosonis TaxID=2810561 RepID=A0A401FHP4_9LACO|nr:hypothetical protein NBRC111893_36 [Lentilactobacillus kosonis]
MTLIDWDYQFTLPFTLLKVSVMLLVGKVVNSMVPATPTSTELAPNSVDTKSSKIPIKK